MIVKVFANFREICKAKTVNVPVEEGATVMEILEALISLYPAFEEEIFTAERTLKPFVHVFINGRNIIHTDGLDTRVQAEDQFALFPPVAGG